MVNNLTPNLAPLQGQTPVKQPGKPAGKVTAGDLSFNQVLRENLAKSNDLKFSNHAQQRMESRNIKLDGNDLQRLQTGVTQAAAKGAKESLLLKDGTAFVVSINNRTVITAVDAGSIKDNVFTNIDSAVIV